jgi:cobalamin biosynthetic protein CobC
VSADGDSLLLGREPARAAPGPPILHGGDLAAAEARYGKPAAGWLDLSTGISPRPYPTAGLARADFARLPQRDAEARLVAAASAYFGLPAAARLVPGSGAQALIQCLPRLFQPRRVAILAPTYEEHERAWRLAGHAVQRIETPDAAAAEILVLGNPNNPDGRCFAPAALAEIARRLATRDGLLVVDEAFADSRPELSVIGAATAPGLLVLRSFGKFFGLAGLRLGFAASEPALAARLAAALGPWPVSGPALAIAAKAYADSHWIAASRTTLRRDATRLDRLLARHGLARLGGCDLFGLYAADSAPDLADHLGRAGILLRRFAGEPRWLRFGLPGRAADWRRLGAALADW